MYIRVERIIDIEDIIGRTVMYESRSNNCLMLYLSDNEIVKISIKSNNDVVYTLITYA